MAFSIGKVLNRLWRRPAPDVTTSPMAPTAPAGPSRTSTSENSYTAAAPLAVRNLLKSLEARKQAFPETVKKLEAEGKSHAYIEAKLEELTRAFEAEHPHNPNWLNLLDATRAFEKPNP